MMPALYTHAAAALLSGALAFGAAWQVQGWRLGEQIAAIQAQHAEATAKAQSDARATEKTLSDKLQEAQNNATKRENKLRNDAAAARRTADGLRDTIYSIRADLPSYSQSAAAKTADTAAELLGVCADEYRSVAEQADRHAADSVMLLEAWPVSTPKTP